MIKSMTGFGRAEGVINDTGYLVEIRSLNGKLFDVNLKIPQALKPYEFEIRNIIQEGLARGSVECFITVKQNGSAKSLAINTDLIKSYINQMKSLASEMNVDDSGLLAAILRLPEVVAPSTEVADEEEWKFLKGLIADAVKDVNQHRIDEGQVLLKELKTRIQNIQKLEEEVAALEPERKKKIKANLMKMVKENIDDESYDPNRLEQEMVYYIEKIDIREEQVRLRNHCNYFIEILEDKQEANGKKLAFLLQEIGREINTTGSKAYDLDIQKCVVLMKDELEKAKEQTFNVL
ncbi:MAG: YicC family protein [Chitinophagaceae bacterium]|nr:YicC family protein [Chitinophagaceae bacterium]